MTIDRQYRCNLCGTNNYPKEMIGIFWKTIATGEVMVVRSAKETEHHLCLTCLESIQAIKHPAERHGDRHGD